MNTVNFYIRDILKKTGRVVADQVISNFILAHKLFFLGAILSAGAVSVGETEPGAGGAVTSEVEGWTAA